MFLTSSLNYRVLCDCRFPYLTFSAPTTFVLRQGQDGYQQERVPFTEVAQLLEASMAPAAKKAAAEVKRPVRKFVAHVSTAATTAGGGPSGGDPHPAVAGMLPGSSAARTGGPFENGKQPAAGEAAGISPSNSPGDAVPSAGKDGNGNNVATGPGVATTSLGAAAATVAKDSAERSPALDTSPGAPDLALPIAACSIGPGLDPKNTCSGIGAALEAAQPRSNFGSAVTTAPAPHDGAVTDARPAGPYFRDECAHVKSDEKQLAAASASPKRDEAPASAEAQPSIPSPPTAAAASVPAAAPTALDATPAASSISLQDAAASLLTIAMSLDDHHTIATSAPTSINGDGGNSHSLAVHSTPYRGDYRPVTVASCGISVGRNAAQPTSSMIPATQGTGAAVNGILADSTQLQVPEAGHVPASSSDTAAALPWGHTAAATIQPSLLPPPQQREQSGSADANGQAVDATSLGASAHQQLKQLMHGADPAASAVLHGLLDNLAPFESAPNALITGAFDHTPDNQQILDCPALLQPSAGAQPSLDSLPKLPDAGPVPRDALPFSVQSVQPVSPCACEGLNPPLMPHSPMALPPLNSLLSCPMEPQLLRPPRPSPPPARAPPSPRSPSPDPCRSEPGTNAGTVENNDVHAKSPAQSMDGAGFVTEQGRDSAAQPRPVPSHATPDMQQTVGLRECGSAPDALTGSRGLGEQDSEKAVNLSKRPQNVMECSEGANPAEGELQSRTPFEAAVQDNGRRQPVSEAAAGNAESPTPMEDKEIGRSMASGQPVTDDSAPGVRDGLATSSEAAAEGVQAEGGRSAQAGVVEGGGPVVTPTVRYRRHVSSPPAQGPIQPSSAGTDQPQISPAADQPSSASADQPQISQAAGDGPPSAAAQPPPKDPSGAALVGWRCGLMPSVKGTGMLQGQIASYDAQSGSHRIEFSEGRAESVQLEREETLCWLDPPAARDQLVSRRCSIYSRSTYRPAVVTGYNAATDKHVFAVGKTGECSRLEHKVDEVHCRWLPLHSKSTEPVAAGKQEAHNIASVSCEGDRSRSSTTPNLATASARAAAATGAAVVPKLPSSQRGSGTSAVPAANTRAGGRSSSGTAAAAATASGGKQRGPDSGGSSGSKSSQLRTASLKGQGCSPASTQGTELLHAPTSSSQRPATGADLIGWRCRTNWPLEKRWYSGAGGRASQFVRLALLGWAACASGE